MATISKSPERVIKHIQDLETGKIPSEIIDNLSGLDRWRQIYHDVGLIGHDRPDRKPAPRYFGKGFGNLSQRTQEGHLGFFIITATQTSGLSQLNLEEDYSIVTDYDFAKNRLRSYGQKEASSEGLTHAAIYEASLEINVVHHAHSTAIWQARKQLNIHTTPDEIAYGTPELASAVKKYFADSRVRNLGIICVGGEVDGVYSVGSNHDKAGQTMLRYLKLAQELTVS